jgi:hypothetical protein
MCGVVRGMDVVSPEVAYKCLAETLSTEQQLPSLESQRALEKSSAWSGSFLLLRARSILFLRSHRCQQEAGVIFEFLPSMFSAPTLNCESD